MNRFLFTLSHSTGSQEISEPIGWREIMLILDRSQEYYSLIELFETPLHFYGNNGIHDGGRDFILNIEDTLGVNEVIEITISISTDEGVNYELLFNGTLDLSTLKEVDDRRVECAIIRKGFWAKFFNRDDTPVDIQSPTDLDGNSVDVINPVTVRLTGQTVQYFGEYRMKEGVAYLSDDGFNVMQIDWDEIVKDDLKKFTVPRVTVQYTNDAVAQFEAPWDGDYYFDIKAVAGVMPDAHDEWSGGSMSMSIRKAGDPITIPISFFNLFTRTTVTYGSDTIYEFTFQGTFSLKKGQQVVVSAGELLDLGSNVQFFGEERLTWKTNCDRATTIAVILSGEQVIDGALTSSSRVLVKNQGDPSENGIYVTGAGAWTRATDADDASELSMIAVYIDNGSVNANSAWKHADTIGSVGTDLIIFESTLPSLERFVPYPGTTVENYCYVTAYTTFPDSFNEGFLIHDTGSEVVKRICDASVKSDFFGSQLTSSRSYDNNGCGWNYMNLKGLHLRGYTLDEKNFFTSFKDWWSGANPIFNLGLGYDEIEGQNIIEIEPKSYFFDTDPSVYFDFVNNIERSYDKSHIFKKITVGYDKWQSEDVSGIDDPQTKKTYATVFETIGTEKTINSKFIAASLAIEVTRRKAIEKLSDWKFDDDTFILAINPDAANDASPGDFIPELSENFSSVSGLLSSETRYNLFLTPLRNFLRWANFFNGALQKNLTSVYKFTSGEGNYNFSSEYDCTSGIKKDCEGTLCDDLSENDDISLSAYADDLGYLFTPVQYEFEHPLSWEDYKTIRENRTKAIGVSTTDTNHEICFIKRLEYDINKSKAKFTLWKR